MLKILNKSITPLCVILAAVSYSNPQSLWWAGFRNAFNVVGNGLSTHTAMDQGLNASS